jgi:hypothetical protein
VTLEALLMKFKFHEPVVEIFTPLEELHGLSFFIGAVRILRGIIVV